MGKNKIYKRAFLKKHFATSTFISNDGLHVERDYMDSKTKSLKTYSPKISADINGIRFIHLNKFGNVRIDEMVITCYCAPKPNDGKLYDIEHIDGDLSNNHYRNLKWTEKTPEYMAKKRILLNKAKYKRNGITVSKDGVVKQDGNVIHPRDYIDNRDLDWMYHYTTLTLEYSVKNRYGGYSRERVNMDELMDDFGFVAGDKKSFSNPVVLHKNNDYTDFSSGNLEWCDKTDQRYIDYKKIAHEVVMEKDHKANHYLDENSWKVIYGDNEPYRDWSDRPDKWGRNRL
ncbi:MAG: hypothetical protein NC453_14885 [Muribaculum sp.]|nr:hypothetical protein [Muribaculum sp.]